MATLDPFAGAQQESEDQKKALLEVIAQSGSAGQKAFEAAQAQVAATRAAALQRANQRAMLTGQNLEGLDTARVGETADRFTNYGANANQQFQQNLQGIGASGQSYLEKINAIAPFIQSQNTNKAADREASIKAQIAAAEAKAAADAQAKQDQRDFEIQKFNLSEQGKANRANASQAAAAKKAAQPTADALLGKANQLLPAAQNAVAALPKLNTNNILSSSSKGGSLSKAIGAIPTGGNTLNQQAAAILRGGAQGVPGETYMLAQMTPQDVAAKIGVALGATDNVISSLYAPGKVASVAAAIKKSEPLPSPDLAGVTKILGGDSKTAQTILNDREYQDVSAQASTFMNAPVDDKGKITNWSGDYDGLTPYDAYVRFLNSHLAPQKTRTRQVLGAQYSTIFRSLGLA